MLKMRNPRTLILGKDCIFLNVTLVLSRGMDADVAGAIRLVMLNSVVPTEESACESPRADVRQRILLGCTSARNL